MNSDTHALATPAGNGATLQMALVMPAIAGIAFAACTVAFLVVGPNRDISDHALLQGRTSLIEASLLAFELPARRIVNFLFVAFFAACSAWLATLALWRYLHGDRLARRPTG